MASVRLAWDEASVANLMNGAGLPALQFGADVADEAPATR